MNHKEIYNAFQSYLPQYAEQTETWFPNGKNSIRVRRKDKREFIFTYRGKLDWHFETVRSFVKRDKGGK